MAPLICEVHLCFLGLSQSVSKSSSSMLRSELLIDRLIGFSLRSSHTVSHRPYHALLRTLSTLLVDSISVAWTGSLRCRETQSPPFPVTKRTIYSRLKKSEEESLLASGRSRRVKARGYTFSYKNKKELAKELEEFKPYQLLFRPGTGATWSTWSPF